MVGQPNHVEIARFAPGVERKVRRHFPALATTIPAQDSLESLERDGIKLNLHPGLDNNLASYSLTTASRVIYLPRPVNGFVEAFNPEEEQELNERYMDYTERGNAVTVLEKIDKIPGVRWEIPSVIMAARILLNHLQGKKEHLLTREFTWTADQVESNRHGLVRLVVGHFDKESLNIGYLPFGLGEGQTKAGVFIVGFPEQVDIHQSRLRLVDQG